MTTKTYTIVAKNLVRFRELEEDDQAIPGTYEVELREVKDEHKPADLAETALDAFHENYGIECLDDFEITCYDEQGHPVDRNEDEARADVVAVDPVYVSASTHAPKIKVAPHPEAVAKPPRRLRH